MNIMKNGLFAAALLVCPLATLAQPLGGYFYGNDVAPSGHEWESPDSLAYNKLQPHAYFFNFADAASARRVLPKHSEYVQSLTEKKWRFHWAKQPSERPVDFFRTNFDVLERSGPPTRWHVELRPSYLLQPASHIPAPCGR